MDEKNVESPVICLKKLSLNINRFVFCLKALSKSLENLHVNSYRELTESESLDVEGSLPGYVCRLQNLKRLSIRVACFTSRHEIFENLPCLEVLDFSGTIIVELPESIGNLCNLEVLDLSNTNIKELPDTIGNLRNLKVLNLSKSSIRELPDTIGNLCRLEVLDLSNSQIQTLPSGIERLNRLKVLLLNNTPVKEIPKSVSRLPLLETIEIEHCYNLRTIPWHLEEKGLDISLFWDTYFEHTRTFIADSVRIIVFGKQGAGKTLLLKRLCSEHDSYSCETIPSPGLDIYRRSFNVHGRDIEVTFWEPDTSEDAYVLHPLYIFNSLYFIVVIEAGTSEDCIIAQAEFWVDRIYNLRIHNLRTHSEFLPLHIMLLVNCREEDREENLPDEEKLQHEFSHMRVIIHVAYLSVADANDVEFEQHFVQKLLEMIDPVSDRIISAKEKQALMEYRNLSDKGVPYIQTALPAYDKYLDGSSYLTLQQYFTIQDEPIYAVHPSRLLQAIRILSDCEEYCVNEKWDPYFLTEDQIFEILQNAKYFNDMSQAKFECQWLIEVLNSLKVLGKQRDDFENPFSGKSGLFTPVVFSDTDSIPFPDIEQPHIIYEIGFKFLPFNLLIPLSVYFAENEQCRIVQFRKNILHIRYFASDYTNNDFIFLLKEESMPILRIFVHGYDPNVSVILAEIMECKEISEHFILNAEHYIVIDQEERPINVRELLAEEKKGELYYQGENGKYNIDDLLCQTYGNHYYMVNTDLKEENSDPADFNRLFLRITDHVFFEPRGFTYLNLKPIEKNTLWRYSSAEEERESSIKRLAEYGFLKWDGTAVSELCEKIGELKGIKTIDLNGTPIKALPIRIGELKRLFKLDLFNTQISSLPDTLSDLNGLQSLFLDGTPISIFPEVVTQLTNLEVLSLQNTQIEKIPESIGNLTHLRILNLRGTQITELPESIAGLKNLHVIDISDTPTGVLPDWIETMTNLKILALDGTNIVEKSPRIARLSDLQRKKTGVRMVKELLFRNDTSHASRTLWKEISAEYEDYFDSLEEEY